MKYIRTFKLNDYRCYIERQKLTDIYTVYVACCLDMCVAVQSSNEDNALRRLDDVVRIKEQQYIAGTIHKIRTPPSEWIKYYFYRLLGY
jgi:hypothetical protein